MTITSESGTSVEFKIKEFGLDKSEKMILLNSLGYMSITNLIKEEIAPPYF